MSGVLEVSRAWCACLKYWRRVRLGVHVWSTGGESGLVRMSGVLEVSRAWCACLEYWR